MNCIRYHHLDGAQQLAFGAVQEVDHSGTRVVVQCKGLALIAEDIARELVQQHGQRQPCDAIND